MSGLKEVDKIISFINDHLAEKSICYVSLYELKRIYQLNEYNEFKELLHDICADELKFTIDLNDKVVGFFPRNVESHNNVLYKKDTVILRKTDVMDLSFLLSVEEATEDAITVGKWTKEDHIYAIDKEDIYHYCIEKDGIGIAYITCIDHNKHHNWIEISRIKTLNQGSTFGSQAVDVLVEYLFKKLGVHRVRVDININHKRVKNFFEALGFKEEGVLRDVLYFNNVYQSVYRLSKLSTD